MPKKPTKIEDIIDEPGWEDRFQQGVKKAVTTPPKPFTPSTSDKPKGDASKGKKRDV
jgi:hypothetical protein